MSWKTKYSKSYVRKRRLVCQNERKRMIKEPRDSLQVVRSAKDLQGNKPGTNRGWMNKNNKREDKSSSLGNVKNG